MAKTEKEIAEFSPSQKSEGGKKQTRKKQPKKKWHFEYLFFTTSGGNLVAAGKNAKQNDELAAKHLSENDLFRFNESSIRGNKLCLTITFGNLSVRKELRFWGISKIQ